MGKDFSTLEDSNRSSNPSIHDALRASRREALRIGVIAGIGALLQPLSGCASLASRQRLGFTAVQLGMHHDGVAFFPFDGSSTHGLIALNHEYTDDGLLHPDGFAPMTPAKVRKSQHAHGLSVCEVQLRGQQWAVVRPSRFAHHFTLDTPFAVGGPAAGHPLMRTSSAGACARKACMPGRTVIHGLMCRRPPTNRTALAGWWRSTRWTRTAPRQAHSTRSRRARRRLGGAHT